MERFTATLEARTARSRVQAAAPAPPPEKQQKFQEWQHQLQEREDALHRQLQQQQQHADDVMEAIKLEAIRRDAISDKPQLQQQNADELLEAIKLEAIRKADAEESQNKPQLQEQNADEMLETIRRADAEMVEVERKTVVVGISGVSRSGKGWVAKGLLQAVEAMGKKATIIGQDDFWFQACQVNVRGQSRTSEEEAECTNHEKFAAVIKDNTNTHDVVIAEGFQLMYHPQVTALLNHIILIELDRDEARRRRTQPRDAKLNPNPLQPADFDDLLWPAHERYVKDKVAPLGARVVQVQSPANTAQRDELVHRIMHAAGLVGYTMQDKPQQQNADETLEAIRLDAIRRATAEENTPQLQQQNADEIMEAIKLEAIRRADAEDEMLEAIKLEAIRRADAEENHDKPQLQQQNADEMLEAIRLEAIRRADAHLATTSSHGEFLTNAWTQVPWQLHSGSFEQTIVDRSFGQTIVDTRFELPQVPEPALREDGALPGGQ